MPEGEALSGQPDGGNVPEKPDGNVPDEKPGGDSALDMPNAEVPDGELGSGNAPEMPRDEQPMEMETIEVTVRDNTVIKDTSGDTLYAENLQVETDGESAAAVRSDRGGGTMYVNGGSLTSYNGGLFYTTNTESTFSLSNVHIKCNVLESFVFYDDYKPTLRILQEGLGE